MRVLSILESIYSINLWIQSVESALIALSLLFLPIDRGRSWRLSTQINADYADSRKHIRNFVKSVSTIIIKIIYFLDGALVTTKFEEEGKLLNSLRNNSLEHVRVFYRRSVKPI